MAALETYVILVNPSDEAIGTEEKLIAHQYGMLHRAFSVLIFREQNGKKELLLQKRNIKKYHCGGLWTNTCCSHPRPEEADLLKAAENRLKEEMGISVPLHKKGVFHYIAKFDNGLCENEIDHVFVGTYQGHEAIEINLEEVEDFRWVEVNVLRDHMATAPEQYTPWLKEALQIATS